MELIIGRDQETARLKVTMNNTPHQFGQNHSVPQSVSRVHCKLTVADDDTMRIHNLNPNNQTYVNNIAVIDMAVTRGDKVLLGKDRYPLPWQWIDDVIATLADIRPLRQVWERYTNGTRELTLRTQRFQVLRGILPVFTMSAVLIGYISGGRGLVFYIIYLFVIALTVFFSYKAWKDITKNDLQREKMRDSFQRDYCCPKCGYFFGFTDYHILSRNYDSCPRCRRQLRK